MKSLASKGQTLQGLTFFVTLASVLLLLLFPSPVHSQAPSKLGVHILETEEVNQVANLLPKGGYITTPVRLDQLDEKKWQKFFDDVDRNQLIPIIRLATRHSGQFWERPSRKEIVGFSSFFSSLDWHRGELIIIAFNEPNHAPEWGGTVDAQDYGDTVSFLTNWFHTEQQRYIVLPAALDVAAPNGKTTQAARDFLAELIDHNSEAFQNLDGWNSHAYPNPGFSGQPTDTHKMSVKSYQYELDFIKQKTGRDLPVYITETGWDNTRKAGNVIASYFRLTYEKVWQPDSRVIAITPFLFNAQTKPFSDFSLLDRKEKPTPLYEMIKRLSKD